MVDDRPDNIGPSGGSPDLGRPRRPPPTIDLDATEVKSETVEPADAAEAGPVEADSVEAKTTEGDSARSESVEGTAVIPPREPPRRAALLSSVLISGATGVVAAVVVIGLASLMGWPAASESVQPQVSGGAIDTLTARVARIEAKPVAASSSADSAISARLDDLEKSLAALRRDLASLKSQSDRAAGAIDDLKAAPRGGAAAADLTGINDRIGQLERTVGALKTAAAQQAAKPADDPSLRRVVAASLLDGSVRQGDPYVSALAMAKQLAVDGDVLKPLDGFATTGLPNAAALSRELLGLLPKLAQAQDKTAATTGSGLMERLQAEAAKLVRIERTDAVAGDDRHAVIARIAAAARGNDIAAARREVNTLPPADRATLQSWTDRVDARDAALAASRQFAADATAALSKPAP